MHCRCPPVRRRRQAAETPSVPNSNGHGVTSACGVPLARCPVNAGSGRLEAAFAPRFCAGNVPCSHSGAAAKRRNSGIFALDRAYMPICLNRLIFRRPTFPAAPDFFWVHLAARHRAAGSGRFPLEAASEAV